MIAFNQIPVDVRTPGHYVEFDNTRAVQGLPAIHHKIIVFGQRLAAGAVAAGVPTRVLSASQAEGFFGRGSMLAQMLGALKAANTHTECWAIAQDDLGGGVKATGTITVTGPATESGVINLLIGGRRVQVGVTSGDAQNAIATAINAAVNLVTDLPVTSGVAANVVTLTSQHKGENGNYIDVRANYYFGERTPKGVTLAIVAVGVTVAGAGNPDVAASIAALGDEQYHTWIVPYTDAANLTKFETALSSRFGPMVQKEGHSFAAVSGTHGAGATLGNSRNSPHLTIMGLQKSPTPTWETAAIVGAIDAYEPDPARPRQTLNLVGVLAPAESDRYTRDERNIHLYDGISTFIVDAGARVLIERLITTYKTNSFGIPDVSYLDVETLRTIAYLRFSVRARIALKFPRYKLAKDGQERPGQPIVTPRVIRGELIALFRQWEDAGLAEDIEQYKADLLVVRSETDVNRVDAIIPPNIINQFRVFAGQVQFRL